MSFLFHFYVIRGKYLTLSFHKICFIIQGALPRAACRSPTPAPHARLPPPLLALASDQRSSDGGE